MKIKNDKSVNFVILHYASFALQDWNQKEMEKTTDGFTARIPSDDVLKKGVIYYIEAIDSGGRVISSFGSLKVPIFVETYLVKRAGKIVDDKVIKSKKSDDLSLKDELSIFEIDSDVETVSKKVQKSKLAPGIVSVIPRSLILKTGAKNLIDVLKYLPGIDVKILPSGRYSVSIRGVGKDGNILLMINGNRINNPYNSEAIYDLSTKFIEKVEVIRGPGSSLFGTDAVAGVINIFTTKKDKSINALGGIYNNYEISSNYSIDRRGVKIDLSGGIGIDSGANEYIEDDNVSRSDWSLTYEDKKFKTDRWSRNGFLSMKLSTKKLNLFIFVTENKRGTWVGPNLTATNDSIYKTDTVLYNLSYKIFKNKDVELSTKVYGNFFLVDNYMVTAPINYRSSISNDNFDNGKITKENYNAMTIGTEISLNWQVVKSLNILMGLSYQYLKILNYELSRNYDLLLENYNGSKFELYNNGLLLQDGKTRNVIEYHLQTTYNYKDFGATLGLRFDYYNDFGLTINPRAGFVYNVFNLFIVKALYGQAFRAPTVKELYDETDKSPSGIIGNKNLEPENVKTSEIAIQFDLWKFNINTNFFYNINENIIAPFDEDGSGSVGNYENIGKTNDLGVEMDLKFLLNKNFNLFFNVSWFQREFTWNENVWKTIETPILDDRKSILTNIPMRKISLGLNFNFKDFGIFFGVRNVSRALNNNTMALEQINVVNIPEYWQFDFNISYSVTDNFLVHFTGVNLGSIHYAAPTSSIASFGESGLIQPGYTFNLGVVYRFNFEKE
jgi:iron complex outermembrane receptor protein